VTRTLGLIGVPSSMGAFAPGQEKGPMALREADLLGRLSRSGIEVADHGNGGRVRRRDLRRGSHTGREDHWVGR
jgi:arginase